MKKSITLYLVIILYFGTLAACSSGSSEEENSRQNFRQFRSGQATSVEIAEVKRSGISSQIRSFGTIKAQDVVNVNPQVSNRVTNIYADLGDEVKKGQVLAKIYEVPFRDALEQAKAQLQQALVNFERDSTQFERQRKLFENDIISELEFDEARAAFENSKAQVEASRAALTQSREDLSNTEIKSPVNGVVLSRAIAEGDLATTGTTAYEIANLVGYETRLYLSMQDWNDVQLGLPVELRLSNRDGTAGRGVVSRISPQLNPTTGLGEVVVSLTETSPYIKQGVLTESRITLITKEDAVVIPRTALVEKVDTYIEPETNTVEIRRTFSVFVSRGDSVAVRRDLELGLEQGEMVEVLSGLNAGEKLIITGHRSLNDGSRIRVANPGAVSGEGNADFTNERDTVDQVSDRMQRMRERRAQSGNGSGDSSARGRQGRSQSQSGN